MNAQIEVISDYFHKKPEEIWNDELNKWVNNFSLRFRKIWEDNRVWSGNPNRTTEKIEEILYD
jgi:hypothetical protein